MSNVAHGGNATLDHETRQACLGRRLVIADHDVVDVGGGVWAHEPDAIVDELAVEISAAMSARRLEVPSRPALTGSPRGDTVHPDPTTVDKPRAMMPSPDPQWRAGGRLDHEIAGTRARAQRGARSVREVVAIAPASDNADPATPIDQIR